MSDTDSAVRERFSAIAATIDDSDWDDVLARSGIGNRAAHRASLRGRAALVGLGALACAGIVVALLGVGFHSSAAASVPGPKRVERQVPNGTIGWLFGHELRGSSLADAHIAVGSTVGAHWQPVRFARVLTPSPASGMKLVVSLIGKHGRNICVTLFAGKQARFGGCAFGSLLRPFSEMTGSGPGVAGGGGVVLAGLASDDVARLELFLPGGRRRAVPLQDNAFVAVVQAGDYPTNLVAYDRNGLVIGTTAQRPTPHLSR